MAQKRMFGARIDEEWISQFEVIAAKRGVRASEIAREAFARYLGLEAGAGAGGDRTSDPARLEALEAAIAGLTQRLERLERSERAIARATEVAALGLRGSASRVTTPSLSVAGSSATVTSVVPGRVKPSDENASLSSVRSPLSLLRDSDGISASRGCAISSGGLANGAAGGG